MRLRAFTGAMLLLPSLSLAQAAFDEHGKWETSFDCAEWSQVADWGSLHCNNLTVAGAWTCSDGNGSHGGLITVDAKNPLSQGDRGFRHWQGDGNNNNSGAISLRLGSPQPEFWIRWYHRYEEGFKWSDNYGGHPHYDKLLYIWTDKPHNAIFPSHPSGERWRIATQAPSGTVASQAGKGWQYTMGGPRSDGGFHVHEAYVKMDTNGTDGVARMWIDGELLAESFSVNFSGGTNSEEDQIARRGWTRVQIGSNQNEPDNGRCMYVDYDDIVIYTRTPPNTDPHGNPWIGPIGWNNGEPSPTCATSPDSCETEQDCLSNWQDHHFCDGVCQPDPCALPSPGCSLDPLSCETAEHCEAHWPQRTWCDTICEAPVCIIDGTVFSENAGSDVTGRQEDTFLGGEANHSHREIINVYVWPEDTVANTILMRQDLAGWRASGEISARLYLFIGEAGGTNPLEVGIHKILRNMPELGAATWSTYDGSNNWTNADGAMSDSAPAEAIVEVGTDGWVEFDISEMVTDWLDDPESNRGLAMWAGRGSVDSFRYFVSSLGEDGYRPLIVVAGVERDSGSSVDPPDDPDDDSPGEPGEQDDLDPPLFPDSGDQQEPAEGWGDGCGCEGADDVGVGLSSLLLVLLFAGWRLSKSAPLLRNKLPL